MNVYQWFKIRKMHQAQIKELPDENLDSLLNETIKLYPEIIDISDGELRGKKGFWSKNLSAAWHNAEEINEPYSQEIDFMIWAIYGEFHAKSIENFRKGIESVSISELSRSEIIKRYIKDSLKANIY